jgi:hypothetical protein
MSREVTQTHCALPAAKSNASSPRSAAARSSSRATSGTSIMLV